ncbi:YdeI/OmpD-associated family protein [Dinghuibacter silviterrae]|uniref:Bacteriocin resistance YdeI/OmpD-like protein n=1 Tax=Dinghuibacter silviterrae TaxID=1539049 RepID=A0A4V3GM09_9BACT|nr:YdeI/OmpD-associated family protein [Dinghuibacter silviterrae]TDX01663.1 bacteriocin resistance YdeI/OmpD-like protein [Dinghuibacter silviterrae]
MSQTLFEKLQLKDEKNLLIQGLPSSIEKQFVKLAFAKNVTPLLRMKKIDFALVFAINHQQLQAILKDVLPALQPHAKLWIAYPKAASKIASDLNRDCSWNCLCDHGYAIAWSEPLDHVWTALRFARAECPEKAAAAAALPAGIPVESRPAAPARAGVAASSAAVTAARAAAATATAEAQVGKRTVALPQDLEHIFTLHPKAKDFFDTLPYTHKKEYVRWITEAKREDTRKRRLDAALEKLRAGKKNPTEK